MELCFLFWNTHRKKCIQEIYNLVNTNLVDVLILSENIATNAEILLKLNEQQTVFSAPHPRSNCNKVKIFTRFNHGYIVPLAETDRITARNLNLPATVPINLICLHFGDKGSFNPESQSLMATEVKDFVDAFENRQNNKRTVLVGDFNMNPFEVGVIQANGLHATMSKKIAQQNSRMVQRRKYEYFYNPMWNLFGDFNRSISGTYYYRKAQLFDYHWNIFDQVLIRPSLITSFVANSLAILHTDGVKSLITRAGIPNRQLYSDHLPITFKIKL